MRFNRWQREIKPENQNHTETTKNTAPAHTSPEPTGIPESGMVTSAINVARAADTMMKSQQQAAPEAISDHSGTGAKPEHGLPSPSHQYTKSTCSKTAITQFQPHTHHSTPSSSPLISAAQVGSYGVSETQAGSCGGRPASRAKAPCRQCIEAKMRQQAANIAAATSLPPVPMTQAPNQTSVPSSTIQQPWANLLGLNPYHNAMAGSMYGPFLQQPLMAGASSPFAIPSQQSHLTSGLSPQQSGGSMFHFGSVSPMPQTQTFVTQQPISKPIKAANGNPKAQITRIPDTQSTTKHIIVDIADTCLNVFPFAELAKRHNQPEQKVRDIFSAVIQVPLLRCPTDKRRAGKLGTARVKEFNQAKKEMQAQQDNVGQPRQGSPNQIVFMPSAWDVAQFMGPSDVRHGGLPQYSGAW
ncbi:uncharacterized protein ColSpa_05880 [Colletotrichum spaethianum]|uniref:Uncharacterized protein n=1 Tax=Colletotrichum spaethianum TaxID=700344 RepID=A0AA37LE28_9PEZI|nr:uncharacterized protein ColSpa_05880 [Colletotrichum spaethianum]GKT45699.1 hypothetical protein ColSpa_05880 [Colletotrichum spaethianum]